jgi:hypothetical protein
MNVDKVELINALEFIGGAFRSFNLNVKVGRCSASHFVASSLQVEDGASLHARSDKYFFRSRLLTEGTAI